jgi:hypothetical protein
MSDQSEPRAQAHLLRWVIVLLVLAPLVAFGFFVHWFITAGHARRARLDAEYHADQDIRTIFHAQREYYVQYPHLGFPCSLKVLGGIPAPGAPQSESTYTAAQLLDDRLASGHADGYVFSFSQCTRVENIGFNGYTDYRLAVVPDATSPPGVHSFCVDDTVQNLTPGEVVFDHPNIQMFPAGTDPCTQPLPKP